MDVDNLAHRHFPTPGSNRGFSVATNIVSAIQNLVASSADTILDRFLFGFNDCGSKWVDTGTHVLPATRFLDAVNREPNTPVGYLFELVEKYRKQLLWEQSHTKQNGVVTEKLRCGIGVWEPDIDYPMHRHDAEEIYWMLAGSALYQADDSEGNYVFNQTV